jgi:hypothetical protein
LRRIICKINGSNVRIQAGTAISKWKPDLNPPKNGERMKEICVMSSRVINRINRTTPNPAKTTVNVQLRIRLCFIFLFRVELLS